MKHEDLQSLIHWRWRDRPVCAYAAGGTAKDRLDALSLFPRPWFRRRVLYEGMRVVTGMRLDAVIAHGEDSPDALLSIAELRGLLRDVCRAHSVDRVNWLITWPALIERRRLYILYSVPGTAMAGVVKIGTGLFNKRQLQNEAAALNLLAGSAHPFGLPSVLFDRDETADRTVLALGGFSAPYSACALGIAEAIAQQVCAHLPEVCPAAAPLRLKDAAWYARCGDERIRKHLVAGEDAQYETAFAHGDLGPGNMGRMHDGRVLLFDWENASAEAPRYTDAVGYWIACHQRVILGAPAAALDKLKREGLVPSDRDLVLALCFLAGHENLAARHLLEVWP